MSSDEEVIKSKIYRLYESYANDDLIGMLELYEENHDIISIGTGEDEITRDYKSLKKQFEQDIIQADDLSFEIIESDITIRDHVAWVFMIVSMHLNVEDQVLNLNLRTTLILEKPSDTWYIRHSHSSLPFNFQSRGSSYPSLTSIETTIAYWLRIFDLGVIDYMDRRKQNEIRHYLSQVRGVVRDTVKEKN